MNRRRFIGAAAGGTVAAGCRGGAEPGTRPNILWIIAEDFSPDLGCYGHELVRTPNIDRMAREGVRFTQAFATGPVCSISRSALCTGMYQTSIGAHNHPSHQDDGYRLPGNVLPVTYHLRRSGYHTSNVRTAAPGLRGTGKTHFNFKVDKAFDGTDWNQRRPDQPFYAQVNFQQTHRAFRRFPERPIDPAAVKLPPYYPDHPAIREEWALYLETAQQLDANVGRVLDRLDDEGLADNTIVFFFSDHGRPMPRAKQFLYDAGIRVPLVVRFPRRFAPEGVTPGSAEDRLVSLIDVTATTLKLAGIDPPPNMHGRMMVGPGTSLRDYIVAARDRCDETIDRIRCIRTRRFKYIRNFFPERPYTQPNIYKDTAYPTLRVMRQLREAGKLTGPPAQFMASRRPPEELYDLESDPYEIRNLAGDSGHQEPLRQLRRTLDDWIEETGDQGGIPENPVPAMYKYSTQVDGWCSRLCLATRSAAGLRVEFPGGTDSSRTSLRQCWVTEGGDMLFRFRARSNQVAPATFFWGSIDGMVHMPDPARRADIDFAADGQWREALVSFKAPGYLALLGLDFPKAKGVIEFDWIALERETGGKRELVKRWDFKAL